MQLVKIMKQIFWEHVALGFPFQVPHVQHHSSLDAQGPLRKREEARRTVSFL